MSDDLPLEVVADILSRLPVHSLLRFRSASKSWRSLIDSRHFSSLHLSKSLTPRSISTLILRHDSDLYSCPFPSLDDAVLLNHPLMCYSNRISLLGSCNGLLCISNVAEDIAFWNPSTRKHRVLPYLPADPRPDPDTYLFAARIYGFGHLGPLSGGDYKLVRISYYVDLRDRSFDSQVRLFSLRTNSWKTLPSMRYALCCARTMGVFVSGALHWVVTRKLEPDQPDVIVAFDLESEGFSEVALPETGAAVAGFEIEVAVLGECLCMVVNSQNAKVDVWVMREYGCEGSWCNIFTLSESPDLRSLRYVRPLGYSSDGCEVLFEHDRRRLCWYNTKTGVVKSIRIPGFHGLSEGMICVGSLLPPSIVVGKSCRKQHKFGCQSTAKKSCNVTCGGVLIFVQLAPLDKSETQRKAGKNKKEREKKKGKNGHRLSLLMEYRSSELHRRAALTYSVPWDDFLSQGFKLTL